MSIVCTLAGGVLAFIFLSYLIPHFIVALLLKPRDLKKAYSAKWGLVTGASSGEVMHTCIRAQVSYCKFSACHVDVLHSQPFCAAAGIGKSLAARLASQGVNVVLVALQDGLLDATFSELKAQFPQQSFRKVCLVIPRRSALGWHSRMNGMYARSCVVLTSQNMCRMVLTTMKCLQIGVNLGKPGYLEQIDKETADIDIQLLFNNAGYMLTGFFEST